MPLQIVDVALLVARALDKVGIPYSVGGSLASSFSGEARFTQDVDILVNLKARHVPGLVAALGTDFYAEAEALLRAVRRHSSVNLIHIPTSIKVDLFVFGGSPFDEAQLRGRHRRQVSSGPDAFLYFHSHEDILLQKLYWYRLGGEVSDRQWRDARSIVKKQGEALDRGYLAAAATTGGIADLVERILAED